MHQAKAILLLLAGAALFSPQNALAVGNVPCCAHAPAIEVMILPPFCWGQYHRYPDSQPQYHISQRACGIGMNHYCPGLIDLNRAERMFNNPGKKRTLLRHAKMGIRYTLNNMKGHPNCPIRQHVEESLRRVNMDMATLPRR